MFPMLTWNFLAWITELKCWHIFHCVSSFMRSIFCSVPLNFFTCFLLAAYADYVVWRLAFIYDLHCKESLHTEVKIEIRERSRLNRFGCRELTIPIIYSFIRCSSSPPLCDMDVQTWRLQIYSEGHRDTNSLEIDSRTLYRFTQRWAERGIRVKAALLRSCSRYAWVIPCELDVDLGAVWAGK